MKVDAIEFGIDLYLHVIPTGNMSFRPKGGILSVVNNGTAELIRFLTFVRNDNNGLSVMTVKENNDIKIKVI